MTFNEALWAASSLTRNAQIALLQRCPWVPRLVLTHHAFLEQKFLDHSFDRTAPNVGFFGLLGAALWALGLRVPVQAGLAQDSAARRAHFDFVSDELVADQALSTFTLFFI